MGAASLGGWVQRARCAGALLAVVGVVACSGSGGPSSREERADVAPTTAEPVRETELRPVDDHGTVDQGHRVVVGREAPDVEVGFSFIPGPHAGPAVLQFGPIASPATCIARATLRVTITRAAAGPPIAVYPGAPAAVPGTDGQTLPSSGTLLDNRPRGVFEEGRGASVADVTELVRTWVSGGPFPSRGLTIDPALPVVFVVQPEAAVSTQTFTLDMTEAGTSTAPTLTIATNC